MRQWRFLALLAVAPLGLSLTSPFSANGSWLHHRAGASAAATTVVTSKAWPPPGALLMPRRWLTLMSSMTNENLPPEPGIPVEHLMQVMSVPGLLSRVAVRSLLRAAQSPLAALSLSRFGGTPQASGTSSFRYVIDDQNHRVFASLSLSLSFFFSPVCPPSPAVSPSLRQATSALRSAGFEWVGAPRVRPLSAGFCNFVYCVEVISRFW